jgi:hypothetical protein
MLVSMTFLLGHEGPRTPLKPNPVPWRLRLWSRVDLETV